jgi:antibiotic biosynthesis monooxygenase (ABM) superfamily enzyme
METPQTSQDDQNYYSSFVVEYIVPEGQEKAFKRWYSRLVNTACNYDGFTRTDLTPPLYCGDGVIKWYSVVHFDTPQQLKAWLDSDIRTQLLQEGQDAFLAYRYKSFTTGLEGWFSSHLGGGEQSSLGPPAWKQVLAVVLGLYPTLMIQTMVFSALGILQSWSFPTSLVINNVITSSVLTWLVMPMVSRSLRFWLRPAYRLTSLQSNALGAGLVLVVLVFMVSVFNYLYPLV